MADEATTDADAQDIDFGFIEETDTRDERELVEMYDRLQELKEEVHGKNVINPIYEVEVTSEVMPEEACEALQKRILNTIGNFRGIVSNERYIPSGVYWDLVREYKDEVIESLEADPDWADSDLDIFREIVMPKQMANTYPGNPVANFTVLFNSKHHAEGWLQEMGDEQIEYGNHADLLAEYVEDEGWQKALSSMAYAACVQDVAMMVRDEDYDLDLEHLEYLND